MCFKENKMSNLQLFRSQTVFQLFTDVPKNLELYRQGDFGNLLHDGSLFLDSECTVDDELLKKLMTRKQLLT